MKHKRTPETVAAQIRLCEWILRQPHAREATKTAHEKLVAYQYEQISKKKKEPKENVYTDEAFRAFWQEYPRKTGKGAALKAWKALKPSKETKKKIIASTIEHVQHCKEWKEDGGKFIPHPATFLNQRRFDDEVVSHDDTPQDSRTRTQYIIDEKTKVARLVTVNYPHPTEG